MSGALPFPVAGPGDGVVTGAPEPTDADGGLFGPLFGTVETTRATSDHAWLQAMLDTERALVTAQAAVGIVPADAAATIAALCDGAWFTASDLGARAVDQANPVVPLVRELTAQAPPGAAPYVHLGATSQDVLDTAAMLVAHRALTPVLADLAAVADHCARLARRHRDTVMVGRTLLQHAAPTVFGLRCAGWLTAVDEARTTLARVHGRRLAVQLGGAVGTLAALGTAGPQVLTRFATELGLAEPVLPWHTNRTRVAELATAVGTVAGVLGKIASDVALLAQTELGELAESGTPGRGGSSAMPHKRNPVAAVRVSACARQVPGLVATLLGGMAQEHERAAGGWQAEWQPLTALLRLVGAAAEGTRELLAGLRVDAGRMRAALGATGGQVMSESVAVRLAPALGQRAARDAVSRACAAVGPDRPLRAVLLADPTVRAHLSEQDIDDALDPAGYLGSAAAFVDRALAAHRARPDHRDPEECP